LRQGGGTLSAGDLLLFAAVGVSAIVMPSPDGSPPGCPDGNHQLGAGVGLPISLPAAALTMPAI